jgi:hypothetical protein
MIRALYADEGRTVMLLGITSENLLALREGDPILVLGSGMGAPMDVLIAFETGHTIAALVAALVAQGRIQRDVLGIALGREDIARLQRGPGLRFDRPRLPMAAVLVYGDTTADVVRAGEKATGRAFPVSAEAAATLRPTPDAPIVFDLRPPKGPPS